MNFVKQNQNLYNCFIESWTKELEINQLCLDVADELPKGKLKTSYTRSLKNRMKRCRWNITRAKNLLK